jgi:hypothetical protein
MKEESIIYLFLGREGGREGIKKYLYSPKKIVN